MKQNTDTLLLIFTRNPELGKCKTRLAAKIGNEAALDVYKFLLGHTAKITKNLKADKYVYYSEKIWENDIWPTSIFTKKLQDGEDLGKRMFNAFKDGFDEGFKKIIIIGSDLFDLSQPDIEMAFDELENNNFVIGPAKDGGYYLLGMKKLKQKLFKNKDWGKETVLNSTLTDLKNEEYALLEERNDIDYYEDIAHVKAFQPFIEHLK